ncbi:MAG: hypothetical protein AAGA93_24480 [Actinomycetota bacterium]
MHPNTHPTSHPNTIVTPTDQLSSNAAGGRPDPNGTRRRHAFWRNVVGPQFDGELGRRRRPVPAVID